MKDRRVGIRELKNRASRIVEEVREKNEPYVVTRRGEPIAVIRPWTSEDVRADRARAARDALAAIENLAQRVGQAAAKRTAASAVSAQRR